MNIVWNDVQFDPQLVKGQYFDLSLVLSVFQWMAEGGEKLHEATEILQLISKMSRYMIFELGFSSGKSCIRTTKYNHYA